MSVKLTCTFSAASAAAPVFAIVSGSNENELHMRNEELIKHKGI